MNKKIVTALTILIFMSFVINASEPTIINSNLPVKEIITTNNKQDIQNKKKELSIQQIVITPKKKVSRSVEQKITETYIGKFIATAYCLENYHHICNDGESKTTADGTSPIAFETVAVDPKVIPYGSVIKVKINDSELILRANDTGSAIKNNHIDIPHLNHKEALDFGKQTVEVWILNK